MSADFILQNVFKVLCFTLVLTFMSLFSPYYIHFSNVLKHTEKNHFYCVHFQ